MLHSNSPVEVNRARLEDVRKQLKAVSEADSAGGRARKLQSEAISEALCLRCLLVHYDYCQFAMFGIHELEAQAASSDVPHSGKELVEQERKRNTRLLVAIKRRHCQAYVAV
jgi:hypothetical protein